MNRRLKKAIKEHKKELNVNEPSIAEIEGENKLLKQQISELRKITDEQLTSEINVQDYLVEMKEKEKKFE